MANTKTLQLIRSAFSALDCVNNQGFNNYRDKIFQLAVAGERQHRQGYGPYKVSVADAAKSFVVRWLTHYAAHRDEVPTVKALLGLRDDCALAAMVAENYRADILKALAGFDLEQLASLDYVALVNNCADDALKAA